MTATAILSSKYQILIPKAVREAQHWEAGQELAFVPKGETVVLVPLGEFDSLFGIAEGASSEDCRDRSDRY